MKDKIPNIKIKEWLTEGKFIDNTGYHIVGLYYKFTREEIFALADAGFTCRYVGQTD